MRLHAPPKSSGAGPSRIGIILATAAMLLWGLLGSSGTETTSGPVSDAWRTISTVLCYPGYHAPWLAGLSASLLVLAAVDRLLAARHRSI